MPDAIAERMILAIVNEAYRAARRRRRDARRTSIGRCGSARTIRSARSSGSRRTGVHEVVVMLDALSDEDADTFRPALPLLREPRERRCEASRTIAPTRPERTHRREPRYEHARLDCRPSPRSPPSPSLVAACGGGAATTAPAPRRRPRSRPRRSPRPPGRGRHRRRPSFALPSFHADQDLEDMFPDQIGGVDVHRPRA